MKLNNLLSTIVVIGPAGSFVRLWRTRQQVHSQGPQQLIALPLPSLRQILIALILYILHDLR
jgi:hypothetical protein